MTPERSAGSALRVVAFAPDLMDRSRIEASARAAGAGERVVVVAAVDKLIAAAGEGGPPALVLVDLARPGVLEVLAVLPAASCVGFASHVDRELMAAARDAGCSTVLTRSAFFSRLPRLLGGAAADPPATP